MSHLPYFPDRETDIYRAPLAAGAQRFENFKRSLDAGEEPPYMDYIQGYDWKTYHALRIEGMQPLEFVFTSWDDCIRVPDGHLFLEIQFLKHDGTEYGDDEEAFGDDNAWLRDGVMTNLFKTVEVVINGHTIPQENYDQIARVSQYGTMPEEMTRDDYMFMRNGFDVPRNAKMNADARRQQNAQLVNKTLTPKSLPATTNAITGADQPTIKEQKAYNKRKSRFLRGSKMHIFYTKLQHPLFEGEKNFPPSMPFKTRCILNEMANFFQCAAAAVPRMVIK
jgi:hypothetical protein